MITPAVHILALGCFALTVVWVCAFDQMGGGLGLTGAKLFNWHPVLMIAAFGVFTAEGAVAFRLSNSVPRSTLKNVHKYTHTAGAVCSLLGLIAVIKYHDEISVPHFYSVHSWLGVLVLITSWIQLPLGYILYGATFPLITPEIKRNMMGYHKACGKFLYAGSIAALVSGFMQKQSFLRRDSERYAAVNMLANVISALLVVKLALVLLHFEFAGKAPVAKVVPEKAISMESLPATAPKAHGLTLRSPQQ